MRLFPTCSLLLLAAACSAGVLNVPSGPYPSIQQAINASADGDEIVVAPGRYCENIDFSGKAITVSSTDPNDPNIVAATIIDGNQPADVNYASVITFKSNEDANSILEGFTITGGTGSWISVYWEYQGFLLNRCGGGILCTNHSSPTIRKNIITNNLAGQGGGIYCYDHSNATITDNTISDNNAIINHGFADPDVNDPNIYDHGDGGAVVGFHYCTMTIKNNTIQNNHAQFYGGGIHIRQWSDGIIENNLITQNSSALGAGVHITYTSAPVIKKNIIKSNTAGGLGGGGIYIYYLSNPLVEQNLITQNSSSNGAGIGIYYDSNPVIRNNLIIKNLAGSGVRIVSFAPVILNNTISFNEKGGILYESYASPVITNNIITSNGSGRGINAASTTGTITYNNVWGHSAGNYSSLIGDLTGTGGNISCEPAFINSDSNDYHLIFNSCCINAADPNTDINDINDFDGQSRLAGQFVDIGALEAKPVWNISANNKYDNIQAAVDDANDGQTIVVTIGTHRGDGNRDIRYMGKALTVRSIDPNDWSIVEKTIIDCNGSDEAPHRGFHFNSQEEADSVLTGFTITNAAGYYDGGAIRCYDNSSPTIKNCIIKNNTAWGRAGGIYCDESSPVIENCTFTGNMATAGYGAAIACFYSSEAYIQNCIMYDNHAQSVGRHGGGVCCWESNATVVNCIVVGNSAAHRGGGLYAYWCSPSFINCTVIGNKALEGGGIGSFRASNPLVINCIVRDNIAPDGNQLAVINTLRVWPWQEITEMTVKNSNIEQGQAGVCVDANMILHWQSGNMDAEPNFADPGCWNDANTPFEPNDDYFVFGNYHLLPGSVCTNKGDNNSVPGQVTTDIDLEQRIFETTIDMGADEFVTNIADFDIDGIVDYSDLIIYCQNWLCEAEDLPADFVDDDFINFADFAVFAENWFWTGRWR